MSIFLDGLDLGDLLPSEPVRLGGTQVAGVVQYAMSGRPIVWEARQTGRHVTLEGGENYGWLPRATMDALLDMASAVGATYSLTLHDGTVLLVRFRHEDPPVVSGVPVQHTTDHAEQWQYNQVAIKLMEVA